VAAGQNLLCSLRGKRETVLVLLGLLKVCLLDFAEVQPKRFLFYRGQTLAVTLESSLRPAHMVLTRAFSIFLKEVLGYAYVKVIDRDDNYNSTVAIEGLHNPLENDVP